MKKCLLLISVLFLLIALHAENTGFSRWSFAPEYGYNRFDGDVNKNLTQLIPTSIQDITCGVSLEYALSPIWGLALDYYYLPIRAKQYSLAIQVSTNMYTSDLNTTINLTRLIFPQSRSKLYLNGSVGIGYAFYTYHVTPSTLGLETNYGLALSVPVALSLEYNFSRPLALGAKVSYRAYNKDDLEGAKALNFRGVTNDYIGSATLFLRYKFNSTKKDHLRNIKMDVFSPDEGLVLAKMNAEKISKLDTALHKLEKKVDNQVHRVDSLYVLLSNDGADTDGDGVPDVRDLEPNTPANTPVDFRGRSLKVTVSPTKTIEYAEEVPAVYFDFDRFDLDDNALVAISKIANRMKNNRSLYVEVRGYCDYSGKNPYNNQLSQRRSDRVKAELVNVWKIPSDHIIANGKGKVIEPRLKYRPNRRCDFFFGNL